MIVADISANRGELGRTENERQTLADVRAACLASAEAIAAVLAGAQPAESSARDAFVPLKTAAAAWGHSGRRRAGKLPS